MEANIPWVEDSAPPTPQPWDRGSSSQSPLGLFYDGGLNDFRGVGLPCPALRRERKPPVHGGRGYFFLGEPRKACSPLCSESIKPTSARLQLSVSPAPTPFGSGSL